MTAPKPPPWPMRALVVAGSMAAIPVLGSVFAGALVAMAAHDAVRAALGRPPLRRRGHRLIDGSHDACTLTRDETGQWQCITERLAKEAPK